MPAMAYKHYIISKYFSSRKLLTTLASFEAAVANLISGKSAVMLY